MSLPRFLDRVLDAAVPVLGAIDRGAVIHRLEETAIGLHAGDSCSEGPSRSGFLLAANLAARLYPRIALGGPTGVVEQAATKILAINPRADVVADATPDRTLPSLSYQSQAEAGAVSTYASGWNVYIDSQADETMPPAPPAALLAAAFGIGELFRIVFAPELGNRGRRSQQPGAFNVITLGEPRMDLQLAPPSLKLGEVRLVGAGAIGQAAALTLAESGVRGTLTAIDHQSVELSNLQRYLLTEDGDVDAVKVKLVEARLARSDLTVNALETEWSAELVSRQLPTLVALDSAEDRIAVQASLPGPIFNGWTQPLDVGWSRHEHFGDEPCLACLYWPTYAQPARHEQIAAALSQHPLRVLAYLVHSAVSVGQPLPVGAVPALPGVQAPLEAADWSQVALLDDIAAAAGVVATDLNGWRGRSLADLYQDGICGGALLRLGLGDTPQEALVPLAHQSAIAGIMLATQLIVSGVPALRQALPQAIEARLDVLAGLPQIMPRPRQRTVGCLCADSVFTAVYRDRVQGQG